MVANGTQTYAVRILTTKYNRYNMTKAEKILETLPSVKIGLDDHYGKQTVLNAINQALSMSGVRESSLSCKKCGGYFGVNINHRCFKCLEKLF
jgi:hypothetical protein